MGRGLAEEPLRFRSSCPVSSSPASRVFPEGKLLDSVGEIAREMATYDRVCLRETKAISNKVLNEDLDGSMRIQEWLFRTYIGSEDNHRRIDALQAKLAAARKK